MLSALLVALAIGGSYSGRDNQLHVNVPRVDAEQAIFFGVKAHAAPGAVHATLANRDKIDADDSIQFFLNPFKDGRQALVFAVNPLGIQADGSLVEGSGNRGSAPFGGLESGRELTDLKKLG